MANDKYNIEISIFDAQAALIDEKSLNRLNRELRECQK